MANEDKTKIDTSFERLKKIEKIAKEKGITKEQVLADCLLPVARLHCLT